MKTKPNPSAQFYQDVIEGLTSTPKHLQSKYFYDTKGDELFQQIMKLPEYYITTCELEIFKTRCKEIRELFQRFDTGFDLIELGAGDALKSTELLKCLLENGLNFTYYPTDISGHVVKLVEDNLPAKLPDIKIKGLTGEFFETLKEATNISGKPKVVLFLGANIGNMPLREAELFCRNLHEHLSAGDLALIGFDLKKDPWIIFNAYNDKAGVTREFNLNLLRRINAELNADFDIKKFNHYETYDPETGACKSYVFSCCGQIVHIGETVIPFSANEYIYMETSQKYTLEQIDQLSEKSNFKPLANLLDSNKWFADALWECV